MGVLVCCVKDIVARLVCFVSLRFALCGFVPVDLFIFLPFGFVGCLNPSCRVFCCGVVLPALVQARNPLKKEEKAKQSKARDQNGTELKGTETNQRQQQQQGPSQVQQGHAQRK